MVCVIEKPNVGVTIGFTVTVKVTGLIHCPAMGCGVNVYTPEFVLLTLAGVQLPL
jgi:hypothetical protein